jgi:hypothetical protein
MRPTSLALALRDPALGALSGALPGPTFGNYGQSRFGGRGNFGHDGNFGADPSPQDLHQAWTEKQATAARRRILRPNEHSELDVMRFSWGVSTELTLSTADPDLSLSGNPEVDFRPQRVTANVPWPAMCTISSMKAANVDAIVGGEVDAYTYAAVAQGAEVDFPTLTPANTMKVFGTYSGLLPDGGYVTSTAFKLIIAFTGPAGLTP